MLVSGVGSWCMSLSLSLSLITTASSGYMWYPSPQRRPEGYLTAHSESKMRVFSKEHCLCNDTSIFSLSCWERERELCHVDLWFVFYKFIYILNGRLEDKANHLLCLQFVTCWQYPSTVICCCLCHLGCDYPSISEDWRMYGASGICCLGCNDPSIS